MKSNKVSLRRTLDRAIELSRSVSDREPSEKEQKWANSILDLLGDWRDGLGLSNVNEHQYFTAVVPALIRLDSIAAGHRPPRCRAHRLTEQ